MFDSDFDPYEVLITLNQRVTELEKAHNALAHAYEASQRDYRIFKEKYRNLEKSHLALANHVFKDELEKLNIKNP